MRNFPVFLMDKSEDNFVGTLTLGEKVVERIEKGGVILSVALKAREEGEGFEMLYTTIYFPEEAK